MTSTADFFASTTSNRNSASFKFDKVGDYVTGTIAEEPVLTDQSEYGTGTPKLDKNGNVMKQLVVVVQTNLRNWEKTTNPAKDENGNPKPASEDTGLRTLWVRFLMRDAIAAALKEVGATTLEVGGELSVAYTENSRFNGFDVKNYKAKYVKPTPAAGFFGEKDTNTPPNW